MRVYQMLDYGLITDEPPAKISFSVPIEQMQLRAIAIQKPVGWWIFPGGSAAGKTMLSCYEAPEQHIIDNMLSMLGFKYESNT